MLLRSGRIKPYQMPRQRRQPVKKKFLLERMRTAPGKPVFSLRKTVKCYILTEDSKTVHFDIDEDGHHEICTKDSQSHEDIAWLSVFTRNEAAVTDSKNLVILTQRSKLNEFVLLCKGKKHLSLKVLKASCSEPDCPSVERCNMKTCNHEDPDFKQKLMLTAMMHRRLIVLYYTGHIAAQNVITVNQNHNHLYQVS
ncbi:uncharacterized protein LOC107215924 isoform X2 [Parus major]|uniref:uncharacterized protein LOC107215924 isoform X2 n=1 Tax=Parus major TaxID=9157 RepID=UPI001443A8BF|nr:uncharacterized protein LOC107215924 isoform X2 [Parus major]